MSYTLTIKSLEASSGAICQITIDNDPTKYNYNSQPITDDKVVWLSASDCASIARMALLKPTAHISEEYRISTDGRSYLTSSVNVDIPVGSNTVNYGSIRKKNESEEPVESIRATSMGFVRLGSYSGSEWYNQYNSLDALFGNSNTLVSNIIIDPTGLEVSSTKINGHGVYDVYTVKRTKPESGHANTYISYETTSYFFYKVSKIYLPGSRNNVVNDAIAKYVKLKLKLKENPDAKAKFSNGTKVQVKSNGIDISTSKNISSLCPDIIEKKDSGKYATIMYNSYRDADMMYLYNISYNNTIYNVLENQLVEYIGKEKNGILDNAKGKLYQPDSTVGTFYDYTIESSGKVVLKFDVGHGSGATFKKESKSVDDAIFELRSWAYRYGINKGDYVKSTSGHVYTSKVKGISCTENDNFFAKATIPSTDAPSHVLCINLIKITKEEATGDSPSEDDSKDNGDSGESDGKEPSGDTGTGTEGGGQGSGSGGSSGGGSSGSSGSGGSGSFPTYTRSTTSESSLDSAKDAVMSGNGDSVALIGRYTSNTGDIDALGWTDGVGTHQYGYGDGTAKEKEAVITPHDGFTTNTSGYAAPLRGTVQTISKNDELNSDDAAQSMDTATFTKVDMSPQSESIGSPTVEVPSDVQRLEFDTLYDRNEAVVLANNFSVTQNENNYPSVTQIGSVGVPDNNGVLGEKAESDLYGGSFIKTAKYDFRTKIGSDNKYDGFKYPLLSSSADESQLGIEDKLTRVREAFGIPVHRDNQIARAMKYYMYNRWKSPSDTNLMHSKTFTYVFFTRPDLNLLCNKNGRYQPVNAVMNHTDAAMLYRRNPELFRLLSDSRRFDNISGNDNFNLLLSNQVASFDIVDETLSYLDAGESWNKQAIRYGDSYSGKGAGEFSCRFIETSDLSIMNLIKLWMTYIDNVARGAWSPSYNLWGNIENDASKIYSSGSSISATPDLSTLSATGSSFNPELRGSILSSSYVYQKTLDYAASAYVFKCGADGEEVLYWSKYYGVFPITTGASALAWNSDMKPGDTPNPTIRFAYSMKKDLSPISLIEFNDNSGIGDDYVSKNVSSDSSGSIDYMPAFDPELGHVAYPFVGAPFIEVTTHAPTLGRYSITGSQEIPLRVRLKFRKSSIFNYNGYHNRASGDTVNKYDGNLARNLVFKSFLNRTWVNTMTDEQYKSTN